ncbi:MAG: hypothetical protein CR967_01890 [Proteobacteria bacterium]|nr:MAG: hypothetical protein CR967_01890 [Pseudomonadota bacterium]
MGHGIYEKLKKQITVFHMKIEKIFTLYRLGLINNKISPAQGGLILKITHLSSYINPAEILTFFKATKEK